MTDGPLTRPERCAEFGIARRQLAAIYRAGGCGVCIHAVHGWGRSACDTPGRVFPRCMGTPGPQFELDQERLKGQTPCISAK
jgi:hypothetical protein